MTFTMKNHMLWIYLGILYDTHGHKESSTMSDNIDQNIVDKNVQKCQYQFQLSMTPLPFHEKYHPII